MSIARLHDPIVEWYSRRRRKVKFYAASGSKVRYFRTKVSRSDDLIDDQSRASRDRVEKDLEGSYM